MEATVSWNGAALGDATSGMAFTAVTGSGHVVAMDGAPAEPGSPLGGRNLAPRPMELLLAGTGGCTAYDVVLILKRGRHAVSGCEVSLRAERAPTDPKVFTAIHFHFVVVRPRPEARRRRPRHQPVARQALLRVRDAREDRRRSRTRSRSARADGAGSDPVGGGRHDLRHAAHRLDDDRRQRRGAGVERRPSVRRLVAPSWHRRSPATRCRPQAATRGGPRGVPRPGARSPRRSRGSSRRPHGRRPTRARTTRHTRRG